MLKKTIKYTDFDGVERSEDFYFNLTKAELTEMEFNAEDGTGTTLQKQLEEISNSKSGRKIIAKFKEIIGLSYGERSADGKSFMKSAEITARFEGTAAYSELFMDLVTNAGSSADFINGLMPADLAAQTQEATKKLVADNAATSATQPAKTDTPDIPALPTVPVDEKFPTVPLVTKTPPKPLDEMTREELIEFYNQDRS